MDGIQNVQTNRSVTKIEIIKFYQNII
jgi:hypothetical protein